MIEKTTAFKVGERFFPCIEDAQAHELAAILSVQGPPGDTFTLQLSESEIIAKRVLFAKEQVLNILTMTPQSHPKARKANGATRRPRKTKTEPTSAA